MTRSRASRHAVEARATDRRWLWIPANDSACQAVRVPSRGLFGADFWQPGRVGRLTASAGAGVLVRRPGRTATLWVSEPPRPGEPMEIIWCGPVRGADEPVGSVPGRLRLRVPPARPAPRAPMS